MLVQKTLQVDTPGRGTTDLSRRVADVVRAAGMATGLCNVFLQHTSASLMLCENADPDVRRDLEAFMQRLVPDGDPLFVHTTEGPDDMPAHVRSILTGNSLNVPISDGRLALGTWQGIYLWEHRHQPQQRRAIVTLYGE